ncbi:ArgR family transcriptional regulator, partial [Actinomadura sp. DSM 109109]|nr:ArgR family transcriptional regulator [Actinomadura lepetitiana]
HTVLGTIAGDDTVLVVCKVGVEGEDLARLFREMAETGLPAKGLVAVN